MRFSALQRAEIAEMPANRSAVLTSRRFSALQRAEIAEIYLYAVKGTIPQLVSVLFNEPKLLKCFCRTREY